MSGRKILVALLPWLVSMAGCVGSSACVSTGPEDFEGQELKILDHGAFDYMFAAINQTFEAKYKAKLTLVPGQDAGTALRKAIDSRGNPVADVIYGVDNALFQEGAKAGTFEAYASPNLGRIDNQIIRLDDFRRGGLLLATPADHGYISVNYDPKKVPPSRTPPDGLDDLARPEWASQFVVEDPRFSSPGLGFLVATVATFGENDAYDYLDYWADLFRNGVLVTPDWTQAYVVHFSGGYGQSMAGFEGDRSVVVSYTTSPAAEMFFAGLASPPTVSVEPARGVFHQVETVAILKCTRQLPLARAFVDFVLSDDFQDQVSANMAVYPAVRGATVVDPLANNATAPPRLQSAAYSSDDLNRNVARWLQEWTTLFKESRA